ncbi:pyridoxamine 5'-phosphate oxidase family protein [Pimelobacter simplex]|uniref:Pyridoxamine 5'-phosphate oxidase family protein n=2 Tax=Nocardioides simplex TaxID=2045 RepID=A0A7J5DXV5_NOCSI|nr:pyridoxamine 5'-phosphate oxidase family protein [Pimelobacter simplex]
MPMSETQPGRLVVLGEQECWDLLRSRPVGRIAWSGPHGVVVVPVNFAVDDGAVVLRTSPYSQLAREGTDREVGFEVDLVDVEAHSGWSVLVQGRCTRDRHASDAPTPWVTGPRTLGLRIEARAVSGRRLSPPHAERA